MNHLVGSIRVNAQIIKNEILRLKESGTTILLSTHNMNSVDEMCDVISLIHKSKQILSGSVDDVRKLYASNRYEVIFKGYYNSLLTTLTPSFKIEQQTANEDTTTIEIELLQEVAINDVLQYLMKSGSICSFKPIVPSMNDIFIRAVEQYNESEQHG
jgi:ABC-2 type transport system ATP-binding protein